MKAVALALLAALAAPAETLEYGAQWRIWRAGTARLVYSGAGAAREARLTVETIGFVARLYRVRNEYTVTYDGGFCAGASVMKAEEGAKRRETKVTFHRAPPKAELIERDLDKDAVVSTREIDIPPCVHDVLAALGRLRGMKLAAGASMVLPVSDGKKSVAAKVVALGPEKVTTPAGQFATMQYEAMLFNDVLYRRKGRLFFWLSEDERRLPVQIRVQLPFYLGTVTLQLEKEVKS